MRKKIGFPSHRPGLNCLQQHSINLRHKNGCSFFVIKISVLIIKLNILGIHRIWETFVLRTWWWILFNVTLWTSQSIQYVPRALLTQYRGSQYWIIVGVIFSSILDPVTIRIANPGHSSTYAPLSASFGVPWHVGLVELLRVKVGIYIITSGRIC